MRNFLGMVRDTLSIDNPVGTWQYGRNMVSNKKEKTVTNEDGFSFEYLISGTVIGVISTNSDIVFFSKNEDGTDEIGVVNLEVEVKVYETKIKSTLFNFQINCPIEGIFIYNYKKELIVAWSDGVKDNSNKPYVLNLNSPPVALDVDKTLIDVNEFTKLYMFPDRQEGTLTLSNITGTALVNEIAGVYGTFAYAYADDDILPFFSVSQYERLNNTFTEYYSPIFQFTNLDPNFNKLQIGLIIKLKDNTLKAYKSYIIDYNALSFNFTVASLDNYIETTVDDIVIDKVNFKKINTLAKQYNQINVGNVVLAGDIDFQKYANLLELIPTKATTSLNATVNDKPSLMPDEVYSIYIELQYLDGSYTTGFHIPGRVAEGTELDLITTAQRNTYGYNFPNQAQFYALNTGVFGSKFSYWQNEETYPNTDDFNSTVDYANNALGGADLRGTPIRYHRVPDKAAFNYTFGAYDNTDADSENYAVGVTLTNFDTIVPVEIKNKIQGYRLSFVKRTLSNSLVLGNLLMTDRLETDINVAGADVGNVNAPQITEKGITYHAPFSNTRWEDVALFGAELLLNTPSINSKYIKINYFRNISTTSKSYAFIEVNDNIKYRDLSLISYASNNNFEDGTAFRERLAYATLGLSLLNTSIITGETVTNGFFDITLISNVINTYPGFKSSNLAILGRTADLGNNINFKGGDVYLDEFDWKVNQPSYDTTDLDYYFLNRSLRSPLYSPYDNTNFSIDNGPPDEHYATIALFAGNVPVDSVFLSVTADLEIEGATNAVINDITTILTFNFITDSINTLPFRIYRSLKISNESLSLRSFRSFLSNNYYEMPNDKGEIIALRGADKKLFIQLKYALFVASIKDTLDTGATKTFLGQSDLFDYTPKEILVDDNGFIGSTSKFACVFVKDMYIVVNQNTGQIFIISNGIKEITKEGNVQWFRNNWKIDNDKDNPFVNSGHLVAYDKQYNRLLFIRREYLYSTFESYATFDGESYIGNYDGQRLAFTDEPQLVGNSPAATPELVKCFTNKSKTLSFNLDKNTWQFEHDYHPNFIFNTHSSLYSGINYKSEIYKGHVFKHNDENSKGTFYTGTHESYIDVIFNQNLDVTKLYQSLHWVTTCIDSSNGVNQFKTIDSIVVYNDHQCSGIIQLDSGYNGNIKTRNNEWFFNDFKDISKDEVLPILDESGELVENNLNYLKVWFEKSNFISKFIVVRFVIKNTSNDSIYLHQVNVKSIVNK
tara:strand:- start:4647 stop:8345 length:3699 start_codon:yes stop_codon:yes gene_type:complete